MDELTLALRQHSQAFRPSDDAFERVVTRGTRRLRTRRIGSAAVALAVFAIVDFGLLRGLSPTHSTLEPGGGETVAPHHTTQSEPTTPGLTRPGFSQTERPTGRGNNVTVEIGDRPERTGASSRQNATGGTGRPQADVIGEPTAAPPAPTAKDMPPGSKAPIGQAQDEDAQREKAGGYRKCSALQTKEARERCWARRHRHRDHRDPTVQVIDEEMPTVQMPSPGETTSAGTEPAPEEPAALDDGIAVDPQAAGTGDEAAAPAPADDANLLDPLAPAPGLDADAA
jgi:hypothetical protein